MGEIITQRNDLPAKLDDLSKFVLVGREKLTAVRAEIRAIEKVGLAKEVREQKLREAQDIAEAVLDAEVRIGELMAKVPKASGGQPFQKKSTTDGAVHSRPQTKADVIEQAGFTPKQVQRFETLAAHPEAVAVAKAEAREDERIVTRERVLEQVKAEKPKPHVLNNSGNNEWYTPAKYVELAREVMGGIDTDPASCKHANKTVKALVYYTAEDDGLAKNWGGRVWMNPPYSTDLVQKFADKLVHEYESRNTTQAIVLVNNATETAWFSTLIQKASAVAFPKGRIRYESITQEMNTPLQGQAFIYFGQYPERFKEVFSAIGWVASVG